jgi:uncharacterized protein (DUF58 family)
VETSELLKKVRKIEIKSRGLSNHIFAGQYHSAFKGRGIAFSEVREYQFADDIRNIDWNVTARFNHPFVKVFEEERELTVILVVDISGSGFFGTENQVKRDRIVELAALLAFSAIQNNDKVGAILFSNKPERFIPPKKGRQHILRIIRELIEFNPVNSGTNLTETLRYLSNVIKKRSIVFVISDFMDLDKNGQPLFSDALKIASGKHDLIGIQVYDKRETELPDVGIIKVRDAEDQSLAFIDTSDKTVQISYNKWWNQFSATLIELFRKNGIDHIKVNTSEDFVRPLLNLFKNR